jgi:hypothetical protein
MDKTIKSKLKRYLLTIFPIMIAASNIHPIKSIDMDVVINPTQVHVHVHCKLEKK